MKCRLPSFNVDKSSIIAAIYSDGAYKKVCRNIASHSLYEDLFQETILTMMELPEDKIIEAHDKKYIKFLFVRIAHVAWNSKTSPFYKKYRHFDSTETIDTAHDIAATDSGNLEEYEKEYSRFIDSVNLSIKGLDWYDSTLLKVYSDIGNVKKVSEMTGIKYGACYHTIHNAKNIIKQKHKDEYDNIDNRHS